ncbi:MAG TPA: glycerophosphodiester phosphodiesterase family protein [Puia sp.]|nr:glycerophosphodiester phosphodiesterase family protein [Puia sp.]
MKKYLIVACLTLAQQGLTSIRDLPSHKPIISGHRGGAMAGYPENCIPTFEHTLGSVPAMFEIDPHLTKDSGIVLLHDESLDRITTGHGRLNALTLAEARKLFLKDATGAVTQDHLNTLEEAIKWAKGKTILNLDIKDVPPLMKAELVRHYDAFDYVMFTVHTPQEARWFYDFDHRCRFSAWMMDEKEMKAYEQAGVPWSNITIAYVGPLSKVENKAFYDMLHQRGVLVMVSGAPTYDKEADATKRAEDYRKIVQDGADVIESDRPIEAAAAIK